MTPAPRIMGILNVTPDSFSDGGCYVQEDAAVAHGLALARAGADIIDVGGESTRPGAAPVPADEQRRRVVPVLRRLRRELNDLNDLPAGRGTDVALSIDTTLADVAAAALDAGAAILNDISAGSDPRNPRNPRIPGNPQDSPESAAAMFALAARRGVPLILMHMQGTPATMQAHPSYQDVVAEVTQFLTGRAAAAQAAGVPREHLWIDPGIGFGKTVEHNLALIRQIDRLVATGYPVVLGASRKRFLRTVCAPAAPDAPDLVGATCAVTAWAVRAGVAVIRVHDVRPNRQAACLAHALARPLPAGPR